MRDRRALICVDIQNDFCPGGALAVPDGDAVVRVANRVKKSALIDINDEIIYTQDWHGQDHGSFASNHQATVFTMGELAGKPQMMWPDHCVQGTEGARFHKDLDLHRGTIFHKGMNPSIDSYSAFYDNGYTNSTGLTDFLNGRKVSEVFVLGLATEYCVKATVMDALRDGFKTHLILEGCRGIDATACGQAIKQMKDAGCELI